QFATGGAVFCGLAAGVGRGVGVWPRAKAGRRREGCAGGCGEAFDGGAGFAESIEEEEWISFNADLAGRRAAVRASDGGGSDGLLPDQRGRSGGACLLRCARTRG